MWKSCRIVVYMQNSFRITRLKCLEICAKIKYKTLDTKETYYTICSQRTQTHALPSSLCRSAARENGQHSVRTRSYHLTVEKKTGSMEGKGRQSVRTVRSPVPKSKSGRCTTPPALPLAPVSAGPKLDLMRSGMSSALTAKLTCRYEAQRNSGRVAPPERSRRAVLCQVLFLCSKVMTTFPLSGLKKMESAHASCFGHFQADQTINKRYTICPME